MPQTIFQTEVNDFLAMHLAGDGQSTPEQIAQAPQRAKDLEAAVFEQFLRFDRISFKVVGGNLVVPFLLKMFGVRGLEALLDQDALGFTLWTPKVTFMVSEIPGLDPLQAGNFSSPQHSDLEQSLELGFRAMSPVPDRKIRRLLTKKVIPVYSMPRNTLAADAVRLANSSFESGKLRLPGFPGDATDLRRRLRQLSGLAPNALENFFAMDRNVIRRFNSKTYLG